MANNKKKKLNAESCINSDALSQSSAKIYISGYGKLAHCSKQLGSGLASHEEDLCGQMNLSKAARNNRQSVQGISMARFLS